MISNQKNLEGISVKNNSKCTFLLTAYFFFLFSSFINSDNQIYPEKTVGELRSNYGYDKTSYEMSPMEF
jgi:hypothetical protein